VITSNNNLVLIPQISWAQKFGIQLNEKQNITMKHNTSQVNKISSLKHPTQRLGNLHRNT